MNPYITHPITSMTRFAVAYSILWLGGPQHPEWFAFAIVCAYYEGREADDVEHRAKRNTTEFWAWFGAAYWFGWSRESFLQAAAAIVPVIIVTLIIWRFL